MQNVPSMNAKCDNHRNDKNDAINSYHVWQVRSVPKKEHCCANRSHSIVTRPNFCHTCPKRCASQKRVQYTHNECECAEFQGTKNCPNHVPRCCNNLPRNQICCTPPLNQNICKINNTGKSVKLVNVCCQTFYPECVSQATYCCILDPDPANVNTIQSSPDNLKTKEKKQKPKVVERNNKNINNEKGINLLLMEPNIQDTNTNIIYRWPSFSSGEIYFLFPIEKLQNIPKENQYTAVCFPNVADNHLHSKEKLQQVNEKPLYPEAIHQYAAGEPHYDEAKLLRTKANISFVESRSNYKPENSQYTEEQLSDAESRSQNEEKQPSCEEAKLSYPESRSQYASEKPPYTELRFQYTTEKRSNAEAKPSNAESRPQYAAEKPTYTKAKLSYAEVKILKVESRSQYEARKSSYEGAKLSNGETKYIEVQLSNTEENISTTQAISQNTAGKPSYTEAKLSYAIAKPSNAESRPQYAAEKPTYTEAKLSYAEVKIRKVESRSQYEARKSSYAGAKLSNEETKYIEVELSNTEENISTTQAISQKTAGTPSYTEAKPSYAISKPSNAESRSQYAEVKPMLSEARPSFADARPSYTKATPSYAESRYQYAQMKPSYTELKSGNTDAGFMRLETKVRFVKASPLNIKTKIRYVNTDPLCAEKKSRYQEASLLDKETTSPYAEGNPLQEATISRYAEAKPLFEKINTLHAEEKLLYEQINTSYTQTRCRYVKVSPLLEETKCSYVEAKTLYEKMNSSYAETITQEVYINDLRVFKNDPRADDLQLKTNQNICGDESYDSIPRSDFSDPVKCKLIRELTKKSNMIKSLQGQIDKLTKERPPNPNQLINQKEANKIVPVYLKVKTEKTFEVYRYSSDKLKKEGVKKPLQSKPSKKKTIPTRKKSPVEVNRRSRNRY